MWCLWIGLWALLGVSSVSAQTMPAEALSIKTLEYEIYYMPAYREDATHAADLLSHAVTVAKAKYGTTYLGVPCAIHLYPTPNGRATTGSAAIESSLTSSMGITRVTRCTVHLLTWSAPEWRTASGSSWGDPKDLEYWNAMLVNEYLTIFHDLTTRTKPRGFTYYQAPNWFVQGLEAYDGYYHATDASRLRAQTLLREGRLGVQRLKSYAICCTRSDGGGGLAMKDDYVDGFAFVAFLASVYGEDVHARLLRSPWTFEDALLRETDTTIEELFLSYVAWLNH